MNAVTERYTLTSELGRGGMATVHRAYDARHGRDVAVKVMLPAIA
jgi:serine/threonine-protein kinase